MANTKSSNNKIAVKKIFPMLVIGGARSGKSRFALDFADKHFKFPVYLATAEPRDEEMKKRITLHKQARSNKWVTIEEPLDIVRAINNIPSKADGILLDCITLWLTNCLLKEGLNLLWRRVDELVKCLRSIKLPIIMITNEVGMGIVPENKLAREFRDIAGLCNQKLADASSTVLFVIAGEPLPLKISGKGCFKKILEPMF